MVDWHKISLEKLSKQLETPDGCIRLAGPLEHDNIVNGDGLRAVVWTQGCPNHCKGCQNPETWSYEDGFLVPIDEITESLSHFKGQAGLTFCGGEPFVQAKACKQIADYVRKELGWDVWSFSGFTYEIIKEYGGAPWEFLKSLDALIDGPFILERKDLNLRFRGSNNQRLLKFKQGTGEIISIE
ncbi:anaerobic ribonucleoside-triphosphate reductase activating protein [Candidatus Nanosyncoccus alces]|uniref:Anaerobic ribonucleoside-triphosphate reductase-activating protein n=1 Tax=Candidatus Nanosyncoccus alces TaxID=2171997 RepID=A0ABY0FNC4_9BACT|nr:anaerobic ribonucleoside-triphosphate reductase activating protein [Candidatus Nanosyncoccus alces]RYC74395.1 Anaerobic ribonucleoside-triphosphate reductase-activating protein [Candidatus Nanosyncoccus alces]